MLGAAGWVTVYPDAEWDRDTIDGELHTVRWVLPTALATDNDIPEET